MRMKYRNLKLEILIGIKVNLLIKKETASIYKN